MVTKTKTNIKIQNLKNKYNSLTNYDRDPPHEYTRLLGSKSVVFFRED